ncbi:MAG: type II secretion system F family protein [Kiritimatiellae bacterium]|nr:type II secretion system F family protein [Kiritimatiellia bacterium]
MASFAFVGVDAHGKEVKGTVEAENQNAALAQIREQGYFPTQVVPVTAGKGAAAAPRAAARGKKGAPSSTLQKEIKLPAFLSGRVKPRQLMVVTRQLATLIDAGLPLLRGLQVLQRQERHPKLKQILADLGEAIQSGSTLADAMAHHPKVFSRLYVNMVKAGEIGGVLDVVLLRLAEFMEKMQKIRNKIVSAMTYPVVVLLVATVIMFFLMTKIVPKFKEIFDDLLEGKALPVLTQMVMNVSQTLAQRAPVVIAGVVVLVVLIKLIGKTKAGRYAIDTIKMKMPIFGPLVEKTAIGRMTRTLGTLLQSGVPILQALTIVRDTAGNDVVARAIQVVHDSVKEGENIAPPMEATRIFPPMVIGMVEVGEETGKLPDMLMRIADTYDDEVDNTVAALSSIIEPLLIVGLAVIVGTIVIALFLPMLSIIGQLGG